MLKDQPTWIQIAILYGGPQKENMCLSILPSILYHAPGSKVVMHPQIITGHHHASRSDGHVEVQRVLHLQSNTMTYHMN